MPVEEILSVKRTSIPGGEYTAVQESDGSWTVKSVPILAEMEVGRRSNRFRIDSKWMFSAIKAHRQLEGDNRHVASVHELHHDPGVQPRQIGFLRLSHVGKLRLKGESQDVLFADIMGVEEHDLDRMANLSLPYRSIEIPKDWRPEISSLALMSTESPEHKLPMLRVTKKIRNPLAPQDEGLVALRSVEDSIRIVQEFDAMDTKSTAVKSKKQDKLAEEGEEDEEDEELSPATLRAINNAVASALKKLQDDSDADDEDDKSPAELQEETDDDEEKQNEEDDEDDKNRSENAKLRGRVVALEKMERDRAFREKRRSLVDSAVQKLRDSGREVDEKVRREIDQLASESRNPSRTVETFVDSYMRTVPQDPPEDVEFLGQRGLLTGDENVDDMSDAVLKFRSRGPDVFATAVEKGREYDQLKASGMNLSLSRDEYIELEMELATT